MGGTNPFLPFEPFASALHPEPISHPSLNMPFVRPHACFPNSILFYFFYFSKQPLFRPAFLLWAWSLAPSPPTASAPHQATTRGAWGQTRRGEE